MTDQLKRAISAAKTAESNSEQAESIGTASSSAGDQHFDMSESSYKTSHTAIRKARRFAMQGLYEWLVTDHRFDTSGKLGWKANAPHDITARTRATNAMHTVHIGYYHEMMHDIPEQIETLNALISQHLDREIDKLDTVEHAILLIGTYELQNRLEIPYKVVLDEAMKLNNHFGATDAHKLINAVLDRIAVELRDVEVQADTKANLRTSQKTATKQANVKNDVTQVDTSENVAETDDTATASTKPRISANNASVKRNRPNKANAGMSIKAAVENSKAKEESAKSIASDKADGVVDATVDDISTDDVAVDNEAVNNDSVNENAVVDNDTTATDATVSTYVNTDTDNVEASPESESSIVENEVSNTSATASVETSDSDSASVETNSSEITDIEVADPETDSSQIEDSATDSTVSDTTDAKSKD
ncbi:transcription antitermination factor NusB [Psychrobacter sp. LV10R520-6]|uniref:transcription antitermination factor NusB n=1 Tax=Psychrobacter sp. LV10R520-6 TaxID=1415574 RepID=UPI0024C7562C|nr:transcription antitermination factor NusB [Psychrobacter sp. LV10R520-6]SNT70964.1 NusB antitermination factor [Psychrobacter sp. LV10R520-6]